MESKIPKHILLIVTAAVCIGMLFVPPIAQTQAYHQFADTHNLLGIPNALNVLSNILFLLATSGR